MNTEKTNSTSITEKNKDIGFNRSTEESAADDSSAQKKRLDSGKDFHLDVPLNKRVWQVALPASAENLLHSALFLVDTLLIARYGKVPLVAAGICGVILWRLQMVFGSIDKGTIAMSSRATGEKNSEKLSVTVAQSLILAFIIGLGLTILTPFIARPFLVLMKAEAAVVEAGIPYLVAIGMVFMPRMMLFVISASLRATGDTKTPMWVTLGMNIINAGFNFPLIYGIPAIPALGFAGFAGWGLTGSGIATAFSVVFGMGISLWVLFYRHKIIILNLHHFRPNVPVLKSICRISLPSFIEEILISFGFIAFNYLITNLGTDAFAAHVIAGRLESLSFMAGVGFAIAAAALVGQSLGMKDVNRARDAFRLTTKYSVVIMSIIAVFLAVLSPYIVNLFKPENLEIENMAAMLLVIAAVEQPLLAIGMTLSGGLKGAGDTWPPLISSLVCNIIIRVGAAWFFAGPMGYGVYGIYLGTIADWFSRCVFLYIFYKKERWTRIRF